MKNTSILLVLVLCVGFASAQYKVEPPKGYSPKIGDMVYMLEELKNRITTRVKDMNTEQIDYLVDDKANSIGGLILHLAATEAYYQVETLENRTFTSEEEAKWQLGAGLGIAGREQIKGKPIAYYLDIWDEVRLTTLKWLKQKNDAWFAESIDGQMSNHWAWYHVMEHQAAHMGQITQIEKRIP